MYGYFQPFPMCRDLGSHIITPVNVCFHQREKLGTLGEYLRFIPTTDIWSIEWLYKAIWGNIWGTAAIRYPPKGTQNFPLIPRSALDAAAKAAQAAQKAQRAAEEAEAATKVSWVQGNPNMSTPNPKFGGLPIVNKVDVDYQ